MSILKNFITIALLACLFSQSVQAQTNISVQPWPNRSIRWVLPYPAGGTSDVLTRLLAQQLSSRLGQQVIVENRPGANGLIGTDIVAKAAPDGYTMVVGVIGPLTVLPHMVKMQYDQIKDGCKYCRSPQGLTLQDSQRSARSSTHKTRAVDLWLGGCWIFRSAFSWSTWWHGGREAFQHRLQRRESSND